MVKNKQKILIENIDYYYDSGLMVLTERYLKNRGYCCKNGCRHCPYGFNKATDTDKQHKIKKE